jgi:hypothetical protein
MRKRLSYRRSNTDIALRPRNRAEARTVATEDQKQPVVRLERAITPRLENGLERPGERRT